MCFTTSGKVEECGERLVATIKDSQTTIVAEKTTKLCNFVQVLILVQVPFTYMICVPLHALMAKKLPMNKKIGSYLIYILHMRTLELNKKQRVSWIEKMLHFWFDFPLNGVIRIKVSTYSSFRVARGCYKMAAPRSATSDSLGFYLTFTRNLRCGENLRPQHPVLFRRSSDVREGSGEGGGVSEGLLGAPLNAISNSTNSRSCKTTPYSNLSNLSLTLWRGF